MASLTQWTWIRTSYGSWWWAGKLGMLQCMGSQRVGHNWGTEFKWRYDWKEHAGCHIQSHVSELKLSLMLIAHSNQAVYHNTLGGSLPTRQLLLHWSRYFRESSQGMMNDHFHAPFYSTALAVEFHFSMTSSIWQVIIKALWQVENLEFGYESLISFFFFFAQHDYILTSM